MFLERRQTLVVVSAATALLLLDVTVVNVALPAIQRDLDASFAQLQWVVDAYALTLAVTLLAAGSYADRVGRRRVFCGGVALFALASIPCAVAGSATVLDVARALQGVGAAAMFATSLALLADAYPPDERGFALGVWGAISGGALALGPLVGGALVDGPGWRWVFLLNLPLGALLLVATARGVRESRDPDPAPADWAGAAAATVGAFLVVLAIIRGDAEGWTSAPILAAFAGGAAALALFCRIELRRPRPMLDLRLFGDPPFAGTVVVAFAQSFALYPLFLFLALWFAAPLGLSPWETGVRLLPLTLVLFAVAPLSGRVTGRVPLRLHLAAGLALSGAALLAMRGLDARSAWSELLPGFVLGGFGIGVISPALAAAMVGVLPGDQAGLASGITNTFRQLGIAVGIAVLGAVFQASAGFDAAAPPAAAAVSRAGFADGLNAVFTVSAVVALAAVPLTLVLLRGRSGN